MDTKHPRRDRPAASKSVETERKALDFDLELAAICAEADEVAQRTPQFDLKGEASTPGVVADIQVLSDAHHDFYKVWQKTVKKFVSHAEMRRRILSEGGLFLKEGKRKGADARMARPTRRTELKATLTQWLNDYNGQFPSNLLRDLMALNRQDGL